MTDSLTSFASARSHQDVLSWQNQLLAVGNSLIVINGGAAAAFVTLYGFIFSRADILLTVAFAFGELVLFSGLIFAVFSMLWFKESIRYYSYIWEDVAILNLDLETSRTTCVSNDGPRIPAPLKLFLKKCGFLNFDKIKCNQESDAACCKAGEKSQYQRHLLSNFFAQEANRALMLSVICFTLGCLSVGFVVVAQEFTGEPAEDAAVAAANFMSSGD